MNQPSKRARKRPTEFYEAMPMASRLDTYWGDPADELDAPVPAEPDQDKIKQVAISTLISSVIMLLLATLLVLIGMEAIKNTFSSTSRIQLSTQDL